MWVKQTKIWILTFNIDPFGSTGGAEKEKKKCQRGRKTKGGCVVITVKKEVLKNGGIGCAEGF